MIGALVCNTSLLLSLWRMKTSYYLDYLFNFMDINDAFTRITQANYKCFVDCIVDNITLVNSILESFYFLRYPFANDPLSP